MTIVEKVKNIINAQASLKEAFKAAFISKGLDVSDDEKLKNYPDLLASLTPSAAYNIVVSPTAPANPVDGMIWIQPEEYTVATTSVPEVSGIYTEIDNPWTT